MERKIQIKLVAITTVQLKEGQEIAATITIPEKSFFNAEIENGLVVIAHALPDPNEPTGYAALLSQQKAAQNI